MVVKSLEPFRREGKSEKLLTIITACVRLVNSQSADHAMSKKEENQIEIKLE